MAYAAGAVGAGWTTTGTILVLFILLVIISRTFGYGL
ncbi:YjcZ family sporulation protein [Paenibacillus turpanensis]|nr:YjcZ family sporulation protein [Paenibacillus turpanensis]